MSELPERSGGRGLCTAMLFLMALALVTSGPLSFAGGKDKQKEQKNGGQKKQKTEEKKKQTKKKPQEPAPSAGLQVPLKGLSTTQTREVYHSVCQSVFFEQNYEIMQREETARAGSLDKYQWFQKPVKGGRTKTLLVGYTTFASKPNRLSIWGEITGGDGQPKPNPDTKKVQSAAKQAANDVTQTDKKFAPSELEIEPYQLSFINPAKALETLGSLGFTTGPPEGNIPLAQLPLVWKVAESPPPNVVGGKKNFSGDTNSGRTNRVFILYHPMVSEEVNRLKSLLEQKVDVPARQVLIESMIVELREGARRELGVNWDWSEEIGEVSGSFQPTGEGTTPLNLTFDEYGTTGSGNINELVADLRALVKEDRAELLSTPSVLTGNNSSARIRVIREEPVLNQVVTGYRRTTEINVDYKDVGVKLNIKPRISQDGNLVTMQIRTEVSEVPEYVTVPVAGSDQPRKVAPIVSTREVETVARVDNNTPFIIGGLIRTDTNTVTDGIPLLRSMPLLGPLFRVKTNEKERREDIIVLTPRVIEPYGPKRPAQPKDSEMFDFMENRLFRNSYRIKAEDVFDLGFVRGNEEIMSTIEQAREFATGHPEMAEDPPFDEVREQRLPGEQAIVVRMIYEIIQKLGLHNRIQLGNLIYFEKAEEEAAGYDVQFLKRKLDASGVTREGHFPGDFPRKVLVLRYERQPGQDTEQAARTPVAEAEVKVVASEQEMEQLWQEGNNLDGYTRNTSTMVIANRDHLKRLKTAILVREILNVNPALLSVQNFNVGRRITIPEIEEESDRIFLVDHNVSLYHYQTEFYYAAFKDKLKKYVEGIREVLSRYGR